MQLSFLNITNSYNIKTEESFIEIDPKQEEFIILSENDITKYNDVVPLKTIKGTKSPVEIFAFQILGDESFYRNQSENPSTK